MKPVIPLLEPGLLDLLEHFSSSSSFSSIPVPSLSLTDRTATLALVFRAVFGREIDVVEAGQLLPLLPSPLASRLVETTCAGLSCGFDGTYSRLATLKAVVKLALGQSVTSSELDNVLSLLPPSLFTHVEQYICPSKESYLEWLFIALSAAAIASLFVAIVKWLIRCPYSRCTPTDVLLARTPIESASFFLDATASNMNAFDSSDDSLATSDPEPASADTTLTAALPFLPSFLDPSIAVANVPLSTTGPEAEEEFTALTPVALTEEVDVSEDCSIMSVREDRSMETLLGAEVAVQESKDDTSLTVSVTSRIIPTTRISPSAAVSINAFLKFRAVSPLPIPFLRNVLVNPAPLLPRALRIVDVTGQIPRLAPFAAIHFGPEVDARANSVLAEVDARPVAQPQQKEPVSCQAPVIWTAHGRHDVYITIVLPAPDVAAADCVILDQDQLTTLASSTSPDHAVKTAAEKDEHLSVASLESHDKAVCLTQIQDVTSSEPKGGPTFLLLVKVQITVKIVLRSTTVAAATIFKARAPSFLFQSFLPSILDNPSPLLRRDRRLIHYSGLAQGSELSRISFGPAEGACRVRNVFYKANATQGVAQSRRDDVVFCQTLVLWTTHGRHTIPLLHTPLEVLPAAVLVHVIATALRRTSQFHAYATRAMMPYTIEPQLTLEDTTKALVWCSVRHSISDLLVPLRLQIRRALAAAQSAVETAEGVQPVIAPCQKINVWSSNGCILPPTQSSAWVPSYTTDLVGRIIASSLRDLHGFYLEVEECESGCNDFAVPVSDSRTAVVVWCPTRQTFEDLPIAFQCQIRHALKAARARPATQEDFLIELQPRLPKQPSPSSPSLPSIDVLVDTTSAKRSAPGNSLKGQGRPGSGTIGVAGFVGAPGATINPRAPVSHGHLRNRHPTCTSPAIPPSSSTMIRSNTAPLSSSPIKNDGKARTVVLDRLAGKASSNKNQAPFPLCSLDCNARSRGPVLSERLAYPKPKPPALQRPLLPVVFQAKRRPADHQCLMTDVWSDGSRAMRLNEAQPSCRRHWWDSGGLGNGGFTEHHSRSMPHSAYANHETGEKRTSRARR